MLNSKKLFLLNLIEEIINGLTAIVCAQWISWLLQVGLEGNMIEAFQYAIGILLLTILSSLLQILIGTALSREKALYSNRCRWFYIDKYLRSYIVGAERSYGSLTENLTNDIDTYVNFNGYVKPLIVTNGITAVGYFLFCVLNNWLVGGTLLCISLMQLIPPVIVEKYMAINYDECRDLEGAISDKYIEAIEGFETIKMYDGFLWWKKGMQELHKKYLRVGHKTDRLASVHRAMNKALEYFLKYGTFVILGVYVLKGLCTKEVAISAIYLSTGFYAAMQSIFTKIPEISIAKKAESRLEGILAGSISSVKTEGRVKISKNSICVSNCSIAVEGITLFDHYNQMFERKNYVIRGENGTGKTTFLNYLAGLYTMQENTNEQDISYVMQEDAHFSFTPDFLYSSYGEERKSKIIEKAKELGLSEKQLKETPICDLSGGELKKVFLSIGFGQDTSWLLLDEPTNSLDQEGRIVLQRWIGSRSGVITVTHDKEFQISGEEILFERTR